MTRHYASVALGKIEDVLALETLLEATRSERGEVRCNAVEGLGYKRAEQAFERVLALLNDEHNEVRARAVSSLAKLDGTRALPYMIKMLGDPDHTVQSALSPALGFLPLDVVPILMQRLRHPNLGHSAEGLYRLASNYWNFAQEGDLAVEAALNALDTENLNRRVIAAWLLVVYCSRQMSQRMEWFRKGLNLQDFRMPELHQRVIEAIVVLLQDPDADIRLCAVKALYETPDKKAVDGLIRCLADDDQYIVQQAAEVLGRLADERAVSGLSKLLVSQEKMTCINAMTALGRIGGEAAWQALVNMLAHPDAWTRHCAAHSLSDVGDNSVVPILLEKLKHETAIDAREGIVYSLGRLQDKRATVMIGGILTDMSDLSWAGWRLRGTAAFALSMIRDEAALPALFEAANTAPEWQVRMQAVEALAAIGSPQEQADRLFGLLEHENDTVRTTAAKGLGVLGAGTDDLNLRDYIVSNLITRLYDTGVGYHASPTVAHMAAKSLYYVGTTEAIVALRNWEQGQADSSV
jgi:HEAT repeat protein